MKKKFLLLISFILTVNFYAQEVLTRFNTSWFQVITGKVMSEPAVTSFGFCLITDSKSISSFTNTGKLLWEKDFKQYRDSRIYTLPEDFYLLVKNSYRTISVLNPSGYEIWSVDLDMPVYGSPLCGRDGRFFIRTIDSIHCFGITGLKKWSLQIPKQNAIPMTELPDGSFVVFMEHLENNKTKGLRISPFGEIMEEIIFAGKVLTTASCNDGVLLTFDDGTAGLFALSSNRNAENKWVLQTKQLKPKKQQCENAFFIVDETKSKVVYVFPDEKKCTIYNIKPSTGEIGTSFIIDQINGYKIQKAVYQDKNIFLTDNKYGAYYSEYGVNLWNGIMPLQNGTPLFNYTIFTNDSSLILCGNDWTLSGYKLKQTVRKQNNSNSKKDYDQFLDDFNNSYAYLGQINSNLASEDRINKLKNGNYGNKEITYMNELNEACASYSSFLSSKATNYSDGKSIFETDAADLEKVMLQLSLFSGDAYNSYISKYLRTVTNRTLQFVLLTGISENGYDPDLKIMNSLNIMAGKTSTKDDLMLKKICDSVYSICVFMGRPAYNSMGKNIIKPLLGSSYSSQTRLYARNTLKKIMDLEL